MDWARGESEREGKKKVRMEERKRECGRNLSESGEGGTGRGGSWEMDR